MVRRGGREAKAAQKEERRKAKRRWAKGSWQARDEDDA
jgi:hypothetical protein